MNLIMHEISQHDDLSSKQVILRKTPMHPKIDKIIRVTCCVIMSYLCFSVSVVAEVDVVRVAVFQGDGVGPSVDQLIESIQNSTNRVFTVKRISAEEIQSGKLSNVDVLIHPGGKGYSQAKALGPEGRSIVAEYVFNGGGLLSISHGTYLATNDYPWSLNLVDVKCWDNEHWQLGNGTVTLKLSPTAALLFGQKNTNRITMYFDQGPLLKRREMSDDSIPGYQSLAIYDSEIAENDASSGMMKGTSAIVRSRYGKGRVFCFAVHPELSNGLGNLTPIAVNWLAPVTDPFEIEKPEITQVVRRHVPQDSSGGIAVLVTRDGMPIHRKAYGFVNGQHLTSQSELRLASVTKQYTALCAVQLIEKGLLDPQEKVSSYLPDIKIPVQGRELLVQDLFWHTSGLPNFIESKEQISIAEFKKERGLSELNNETHAEWLETLPARRPAGQMYEYTNSGYVLLTRIIEVISGMKFHDYQQQNIFNVLELTNTTDSTRFNGSGNMRTTLLDYEKWDRALWDQDPRLLTPEGYKMLFTPGVLDNGEAVAYGKGWQVTIQDQYLVIAEHGGAGSGTIAARNWIRRHYDDNTTVAIFAQEHPQLNRNKRQALVRDIYNALHD
ncbi:serine hydrolase [uncultured Rubinisphaera sp.]|uniref:serine hydrolase n=1 Tax=uncultured Rubinisphaera sp. TaxID=1678686 RepID=UPI0030D9391A